MKTEKAKICSDDKKIKFVGFRSNNNFEVENRTLWSEVLIREIYCNKCKDGEEITFHTKDIPKLIKALNKLLELQDKQINRWKQKSKGELEKC